MLPNTLTSLLQTLPKLPNPVGVGNYAPTETTLVLKRGAMRADVSPPISRYSRHPAD